MIAGIFLFALVSLGIPVAIALWNRKRYRKERFGAYYLLKKVSESKKRRIQLLEILKLLNRLALFTFVILVFVEPTQTREIFQEAGEGFAIVLDVSRSMQASTPSGESLISAQLETARGLLDRIPSQARGAIFFMADRCDAWRLGEGRTTAPAREWKAQLRPERIPYSGLNPDTTSLRRCEANIQTLFGEKSIFSVLVSPLPEELGEDSLQQTGMRVEKLPVGEIEGVEPVVLRQESYASGVSLNFSEDAVDREMFLLQPPIEDLPLGNLSPRANLPLTGDAWLWIRPASSRDPWLANQIVPLEQKTSFQVVAWTLQETQGYRSLLSALRSHPQINVVRQLGGRPVGENVIIYGPYPYELESLRRAWFFTPISGTTPFDQRDQKVWSSSAQSLDLRRSFEISSSQGDIFIRRYNLFELGAFEVLETFKDGVPSLLSYVGLPNRIWVSPFDLEDLTTDLTLEPSFIPYLYFHLADWLMDASGRGASELDFESIWSLPGRYDPHPQALSEMSWPGIYRATAATRIVHPDSFPKSFLEEPEQRLQQAGMSLREESLRELFIQLLVFCLFIELALCLMTSSGWRFWGLLFVLQMGGGVWGSELFAQGPSGLSDELRNRMSRFFAMEDGTHNRQQIAIGYVRGMETQRRESLRQTVEASGRRSNLDFAEPREVTLEDLWKHSAVVLSMSGNFPQWSDSDREKIRDYLERGGLFIFDDPTAVLNSSFYRWATSEMEKILPGRSFKNLPRDSVIFRTYYLLDEVSGRRLSSPHLQGVELDGRWVALFSSNDLLGASYRLPNGDYGFSVSPYGAVQRVLAERLFLNMSMYSVTIDYKDDAIHLPHILRRRVR